LASFVAALDVESCALSKEPLRIEYLEKDSEADWSRLLAESQQATIYSSPEYLSALCEATGGTYRLLGVRRGTELVAGLGVYEERTPIGPKVSPRYLLYFNSILVRDYETRFPSQKTARSLEALRAIDGELSARSYVRVRLHNHWSLEDVRPFLEGGWHAAPSYTYVADLTDLDGLSRRVDRNFQRLIRRCRAADLTPAEDDDFASLYRLHAATHERKGAPIYLAQRPFTTYFRRLKERGLCRLDHLRTPAGRSVAAQLTLLGPYPTAHTVVAGADPEFMQLGTTPFLRWTVFEALAALGYRYNDLTDAALNPVTRFKSQLGADLRLSLVLKRRDHPAMATAAAARRVVSRLRGSIPGNV
jgi:hypothetical protein